MKHIALGHFPPDDGAGNDFAPVDDWWKNHHIESMFRPEFLQELHVSRLLVSETKILTDQDGLYPQVANQNLLGEVRGGEPCKFQCERQYDRGFQANSSEPFRALRIGREQQRRGLRPENLPRRWIKRQR